jgi:hypothetical protein
MSSVVNKNILILSLKEHYTGDEGLCPLDMEVDIF